MLTLREALTRATSQLSANPLLQPTALQDAVVLLMTTLGIERPALIAHPERPVDREEQAAYQRLLERRLRFEPIQYILGETEFYGMRLRVRPGGLIPRPETELLVEAVIAWALSEPTSRRRDAGHSMRIVDVGTGSGAIAIALAGALPQAKITAVDLSPTALEIAQENAALHGFSERIRFLESDLLAGVAGEEFDAVISNPPYIADGDAAGLHPQVWEFEPAGALFSGPSGLEIYARLIPQAAALLRSGGLLAMEIGFGQRDGVVGMMAGFEGVEVLDDLAGIPRVVMGTR